MAGTKAGGQAAANTNRQRYGSDFYRQIGRKGGKISRGGGFAISYELASEAGRKGGKASKRTAAATPEQRRKWSARGGQQQVPKGFAANPDAARSAGEKGGRASRQGSES